MTLGKLCTCSLAVLLWGCAGPNAGPPGNAATTTRATASSRDDYVLMAQVLTFTPKQRANFERKLAARNAGFAKWEQSPQGRKHSELKAAQAQAKTAGDDTKAAELQAELAPLQKERDDLRAELRREFDEGAINLDQQRQWAAYQLANRVLGRLRNAALSADQINQVRALCDGVAKQAVNADTCKTDPYLKLEGEADTQAMKTVSETVLTPDQRTKATTRAGRRRAM